MTAVAFVIVVVVVVSVVVSSPFFVSGGCSNSDCELDPVFPDPDECDGPL